METWPFDLFQQLDDPSERFVREHTCPSCGELALVRVRDCAEVHLLCRSCRRCWRNAPHSYLMVDPLSCSGCADQSKAVCLASLTEQFPHFGTELLA